MAKVAVKLDKRDNCKRPEEHIVVGIDLRSNY